MGVLFVSIKRCNQCGGGSICIHNKKNKAVNSVTVKNKAKRMGQTIKFITRTN